MHTVRETRFHGNPVIEILTNGEPLGEELPHDEHFRFGVKKACLILAFEDVIEEFADSGGRRPSFGRRQIRSATGLGKSECELHTDFTAYGRTVYRPYLQLKASETDPATSIGFGLTKAEALLDVMDDIRRFVKKHITHLN